MDETRSDSAPPTIANACDGPPPRHDRALCPRRVGPIHPATTRTQLDSLFPSELVRDRPVDVGEGTFQPGTVVNVGRPDSAQIVWSDSSRTRISMVLALGPAWRTHEGLGMGSSLQEIERALGLVSILGFGWDYGGTVTLAGTRLENSGVFFRTQPSITDYRATDAYNRVRGDRSFASSDADVRALAPVVTRVDIIWDR